MKKEVVIKQSQIDDAFDRFIKDGGQIKKIKKRGEKKIFEQLKNSIENVNKLYYRKVMGKSR